MKYDRLHINHFGQLHNKTIEFSDGINILYEEDSEKSSTLHAFIEAMQYGMNTPEEESSPKSLYRQNYPETGSSTYGGVLEFTRTDQDTTYSIYRNFKRNPHGYTLMDEKAGKQQTLSDAEFKELLCQITHPLYRDTLAIQHTSSPQETAAQYRHEIQNLCSTGSPFIDLDLAIQRLSTDRIKLKQDFSDAAMTRAEELNQEYLQLSAERSQLSNSTRLSLWEKERQSLQKEQSILSDRKAALQQAILNDEAFLKEHSLADDPSIQDTEAECQRLISRREKLLQRYPDPNSGLFGGLYPLLTAVSTVLALFGAIFGIRSAFAQNPVFAAVGFALLVISLALLAYSIPRLRAQYAFRYVDGALMKLLRQLLPDPPEYIDQSSLQEFLRLMEVCNNRQTHCQRCRRELISINEQMTELAEKEEHMMIGMESQKRDFNRMVQLDEQIGKLEAEMDSLTPILLKNRKISRELHALDEARSLIEELAQSQFKTFRRYISQFSSQLIAELSEGRWHKIHIHADGKVQLEQQGTCYTLEEIDTNDLLLLSLSLRIACIGFIWPHEAVPLFLEEKLYRYDEALIRRIFLWLKEYYPGQVFLFTSQNKEEEVLKKTGIPCHVIHISA